MRLSGKTAAVTGSGKGIGRAAALRLSQEGAAVLVADIDIALAEETVSEIRSNGGKAAALQVNVMDVDRINQIPAAVLKTFGAPLDIMVNNAGIQQVKDVWDITPEDWDRMLNTNARGAFFGMQMAAKAMHENKRGVIINMASIMGREGHPLYAHYAASKAAIISLTKSFAMALAPYGIRVNSVGPGIVDTDLWDLCDTQWAELKGMKKGEPKAERIKQVPLGRPGTPADVAGAIAFLASDDAGYITGECIHLSGGTFML